MNKALLDDAFCHAVTVVGLVALGSPKLGEPLAAAVRRVQDSTGFDDPTLALQVAGLRAISAHPEEDAMRALFDTIPPWLEKFTLGSIDRHLMGWPARDTSDVPEFSIASAKRALDAWPGLPSGAAIFKEGT